MKYVIDPMEITAGWCPLKCSTLCKAIVHPMYGVPPGPIEI